MPYFDSHIVTSWTHNPIFGIELHHRNEMLVSLYLLLLLARLQIPNPYSFIVGARVQVFSRWVYTKTSHPVIMAEEGIEVLSRLQNEQLYDLISSSCYDKWLIVVS